MRTADFDYVLPPELIAQHPPAERAASRLLVVHRHPPGYQISTFPHLPSLLRPGDLLVRNNSRVIPARLHGRKIPGPGASPGTGTGAVADGQGGGEVEILLLEPSSHGGWWVLLRPGKRVRPGTRLRFGPDPDPLRAEVREKNAAGHCRLAFDPAGDVLAFAERHGEMPLPPYIQRPTPEPADRERYQTVYAREPGSAAAPTAGLHFSTDLLATLAASGIEFAEVTLHVGVGTFAPVKADRIEDHVMHEERFEVPAETVDAVTRARAEGRRVVAIGTTTLRVLESVAREHEGRLVAGPGRTRIFLHPPARFRVVDGLLTNFHLPRSTLLMLVCAFAAPDSLAGRTLILDAYAEAIRQRFRFFSYGDAMLVL